MVLKEFTSVGSKFDFLRSLPGEFQHGTVFAFVGTRDGAGAEEIPGADIAAIDGVMRELLLQSPVKVSEVGLTNGEFFATIR